MWAQGTNPEVTTSPPPASPVSEGKRLILHRGSSGVPLCIPHPWPCMLPQLSPSEGPSLWDSGQVAVDRTTSVELEGGAHKSCSSSLRECPSPQGPGGHSHVHILQLPFEPAFNLALLSMGLTEGRCSGTCVLIPSFPWGQETVSMSACQQDPWTRAPTLQGLPGAPRSPAASLPGSLSVHCSSRGLQGTKDAPACHSGTWA